MFTLDGVTLFVFVLRFMIFTFLESLKFLVRKGKNEEALMVLHKVAKTNKRKCNITLETFAALSNVSRNATSPMSDLSEAPFLELPSGAILENAAFAQKVFELVRIKILFSTPTLTRLTILVRIIYAFDYWGFSIAGDPSSAPQNISRIN